MRSFVVGIDMGYVNLGVCALTRDYQQPQQWFVRRIWGGAGTPTEEALFWAIRSWCASNSELLENADRIVLEKQMRAKFKVMNTVIRALYPDKTIVVAPQTVGAHFKLTNKRAVKKREAIELCAKFWPQHPLPDGKQDDMADAALLAKYVIDKKL